MEKLSIEEKAKRYDKAIEKLHNLHDDYDTVSTLIDIKEELENIFPELKESEDKRMKSYIISVLNSLLFTEGSQADRERNDAIAWLEKQEEHANFRNKIRIGDKVTRNEDGVLVNLSQLNRVAKKDEEQEQKPVRQQCADFYNKNSELQMPRLTAFENELANILFDREYDGSTETEDDIQRGKLEYELAAIRLAPKLQSLIIKEQKPVEWSEEDEAAINDIIAKLARIKARAVDGGSERERCTMEIEWLKSLRPQKQWKPSIAQLNALGIVSKGNAPDDIEAIVSLYNDLKKLKG